MIYSIWNTTSGKYDYFKGADTSSSHAGAPPRARGAAALGATPEQAAWRLPVGAVRVGSGDVARGRIASREPGTFAIDLPQSFFYAAVGYLIWRAIR